MAGSMSFAAVWPASTLETAVGTFAVESAGFTTTSVALVVVLSEVVAESVTTTQ